MKLGCEVPMGFSRRKPGRRGCVVEACRAGTVYGGFLKESEGDQMKEYKVPVQSLIDHIKTAVDVDDWAKEMAEDLLKRQKPVRTKVDVFGMLGCPVCKTIVHEKWNFCPKCGQAVKWDD